MTSSLNLSGRVAVVTGASRGIGYFIAKELAAAGAHVVAVARTIGGLEELDDEIKAEKAISGKGEATLVPLDLADGAGVDRLGGAIHERWGKLDAERKGVRLGRKISRYQWHRRIIIESGEGRVTGDTWRRRARSRKPIRKRGGGQCWW